MPIHKLVYSSPIGKMLIEADDEHITALNFLKEEETEKAAINDEGNELARLCKKQLDEYFNGKRMIFDLPLQQQGTAFQQTVWNALLTIPFGRTVSYMHLSKQIGNPKAIRAVGTTNGDNQIAVIVPCHRVIGSDGKLTGYAGGLWRKQWLLEHEQKFANGVQTLF